VDHDVAGGAERSGLVFVRHDDQNVLSGGHARMVRREIDAFRLGEVAAFVDFDTADGRYLRLRGWQFTNT